MNFKKLFTPLLIIVIVAFAYAPNLSAYFQQDEWLAFNRLITLKSIGLMPALANIFRPTSGHYTPFNLLILLSEFSVFGLNFKGYLVVSVILHLIACLLVYVLIHKISGNRIIGFAGGVMFGLLGSTIQATSWVIADVGTHTATILTLLSLIFVFEFIKSENKKHFVYTMIFLMLSLFFKEIAIATFAVIPLIILIFSKMKFSRKKIYLLVPFLILVLYGILRIIFIKISPTVASTGVSAGQGDFIYNFLTLPAKSIVQSIIPYTFLLQIARKMARISLSIFEINVVPGTWQFDLYVENTVFEIINVILFICLTFWSIFFIKKNWTDKKIKYMFVFLIFAIINGFVFALSPERAGKVSIVDSRNLYLLSVGSVIFTLFTLEKLLTKKMIVIVISLYIGLNFYVIRSQTTALVHQGRVRENILKTVKSKYPKLTDKVVFYFESDSAYYGLPGDTKIMPFQSGLGQTILIYYYMDEKFPGSFLENKFLWGITDQGYKEDVQRGFGFFRDLDLLKDTVAKHNIPNENIISFSWNSKEEILTDTTKEIRDKIK